MKKLLLFALWIGFLSGPVFAQVAVVDKNNTYTCSFSSGTTCNITITVTAGTTAGYIGCAVDDATATVSATWGGVAMTAIGSIRDSAHFASAMIIGNPATGTPTVTVTASGTTTAQCGAATVNGSKTSTITSGFVTDVTGFANVSHQITCASTGLAVDLLYYSGGANPVPGPGMSQTNFWVKDFFIHGWGSSYAQSTNPTMTWSDTTATTWVWLGFCIDAASGASTPFGMLTLGAGK